jgi:hypothetical protein
MLHAIESLEASPQSPPRLGDDIEVKGGLQIVTWQEHAKPTKYGYERRFVRHCPLLRMKKSLIKGNPTRFARLGAGAEMPWPGLYPLPLIKSTNVLLRC